MTKQRNPLHSPQSGKLRNCVKIALSCQWQLLGSANRLKNIKTSRQNKTEGTWQIAYFSFWGYRWTVGALGKMRASPPCDYILAQLAEQLSLSHPIISHRITSFAYLQSPCWAYITHPQRWPMQSMPCRRFYPCSISISILSRMPIFAGNLPSRGKLFWGTGTIYRQSKDSEC